MLIARTAAELGQVLDQSRANFAVERVPASQAEDWSLTDGALQHSSRGFFSVVGVTGARTDEGLVLLYQPQAAVTGLLSAHSDGELCFLLQARAEPGCLGQAQFGPTVQSTPANFMRLHGGAGTPYVEALIAHDRATMPVDDTTQLDLGERYLFKTKRSILARASEPPPLQPGFVWANVAAVRQACLESAFFNIDLRSIFSIAHWTTGEAEEGLAPRSLSVRRSLGAPVRPEVLGRLLAALGSAERAELCYAPLESLSNWRRTEWGFSERTLRQGFSIEFYRTSAKFREKSSWVQPLVNSVSEGEVVLACRERAGALEVLVRVEPETGLATGAAIGPSYVRYPGMESLPPAWASEAPGISGTTESDEGGRFFRDASLYKIVRFDAIEETPNNAWVRLSELKMLLRTSNICTIQLRGVVSQLLGAEFD